MWAKEKASEIIKKLTGKIEQGIIYEYKDSKLVMEFYGDYDHGNFQSYYVFAAIRNFAGEGSLTLRKSDIVQYKKTINSMLETLSGKLRIDDGESDDFLEFEFTDSLNPHVFVRGKLGGYKILPVMSFEFEADPTILSELKKALR